MFVKIFLTNTTCYFYDLSGSLFFFRDHYNLILSIDYDQNYFVIWDAKIENTKGFESCRFILKIQNNIGCFCYKLVMNTLILCTIFEINKLW